MNNVSLTVLSLLVGLATQAKANEYFVMTRGSDANRGLSRDAAFQTIQKGVHALKPGDTLTIGPGEYAESVSLTNGGSFEKETLIRAEFPGTVLLRGTVDAPAFSKVEGRRFVYAADCDRRVLSVHEMDTLVRLGPASDIDALEFKPGTWYQDAGQRKLYISSSDFRAADLHHYALGVLKGDGFRVVDSRRVVLDGLAAAGFMTPTNNPVWSLPVSGFLLHHSSQSIIRRCSAFLNETGICIRNDGTNGYGSLVENCRGYGNITDGIVSFFPSSDTFSNSHAFLNGGCGIQFYGDRTGNVLFSRSLSWGNGYGDFRMKGQGLSGEGTFALAERCISLDRFDVYNQKHCISGGPNSYRGDTPPDTIAMPNDPAFKDREFADAVNFDFRLQASSSFRQSGTDPAYKGPHPYEPNVYYVKTNGNDRLDGLCMSNAWSTLPRAFKGLRPGDTLYLAGGVYSNDVPLTAKQVTVRGRGTEPVSIAGRLQVVNSEEVVLERLTFTGKVRLDKGSGISFNNCIFAGDGSVEAVAVRGLKVTHGVFRAPLKLKNCSSVHLSANLYAALPAVQVDALDAIAYSSYNRYAKAAHCWEVGGKGISFEALQKSHDADSRVLAPVLSAGSGLVTVENAHQFAGRGPLGSAIGPYREWQLRFLQRFGPFVHSVSDTTANLEWWTSLPADVELRWGDTPECTNSVTIGQTSFCSYSLVGLQPGKTYYVKLKPVQLSATADPGRRFRLPEQDWASAVFTTTAKTDRAAHTYYVSTNGNNGQGGLSRETAWRTLQQAADRVRPGDTVLIAGGLYPGTVYFRATGERNRPITFKAVPGERVVIDGMGESLKNGLVLYGKHYYNFDALHVNGYAGGEGSGALLVNGGSHLRVTRCFFAGGWGTGITANQCGDILVRNCVFMHSMGSTVFSRCPRLDVENNVYIAPLIVHLTIGNAADEPSRVANSIFGENTRGKQQQCLVQLSESTVESNNCFYLRWPETERMVINSMPLPEYRAVRPTDSIAANPQMPGALGFRQGWQQVDGSAFDSLFAANPELVTRGIGLQPAAFRDFRLKTTNWVYDVAWATDVLRREKAVREMVAAGKDAEALTAFTNLAAAALGNDRLKSEFLDQAAMCAARSGNGEQAMVLAKQIPVKSLSQRRQMAIMVANRKYGELLAAFSQKAMGGACFNLSWVCPELEDLLVEAYTCRGTAYAESNDLAAAEADLLVMVNQQKTLGHDNGVGINELAWLRLGDFYRKYAKDDRKALDAYAHVIDRTYKPWYVPKPIPKPVLTGDSQTLRDAVQASSDILRKQGKEAEAIKLHASLLKPRAEALGGMGKKAEAIAVFGEITDDRSIFTPGREAWEKRLHALPDDFRTNLVKKIASETALTVGTQRFLIQATGDVDAKGRATALRAILAFAPLDTTIKWLDEAEAEARKKAVRAKIEPLISRLRSLAQARQWQALINEFKDADLAGWQDAALAGEALYWRGTAYAALKNGTSAAADLKQAVQLAPGNSSWWVAVAENYRANLNDEQQALATFLQYLKEFGVNNNYGENLRVALMAAEMLRSQGRKGEALDVLKRYDLAKLPSVDYRNQFEQAIKACAKQEH